MQRTEWWQTIKQDVVFGLRQLRKAPGFTAAALATLALGIGANSAIFSVVYSVMLKPLPFANSARIITISETTNGANANAATFGNYASWRDNAHTLEAIAAQWLGGSRTLTGRGDPAPVPTLSTTAGWWKVQFIPPVVGHYYGVDDERMGAPPVAVISYELWQSRFNGDRSILGKQITLNATDYTIVGVAPAAYSIAVPDEMVWLPLKIEPARWLDHSDHELTVFALVKPDVSIEQATRELSTIERGLAKQYPKFRIRRHPRPFLRGRRRRQRQPDVAVHAPRRRGTGVADRLRQRGQPPHRARRNASNRDRDSRGARRLARPHRVPASR